MTKSRNYYWTRYVDDDDGGWRSDARPPGEDLAALRRGLGREPGAVPELWPFHVVEVPDEDRDAGLIPPEFEGEHHALTLFGVHQQSQKEPVHRPGIGVGRALRALHAGSSGDEAVKAIDRRFYTAVTATSIDEVAYHLRGLIRMLRSLGSLAPLDYGRLVDDLARWRWPDQRDRVRRRWGLDYHSPAKGDDAPNLDPDLLTN